LFDNCLIMNVGNVSTNVNMSNITNVNNSGDTGIARRVAFRHCTIGPGSGARLSGTLDFDSKGGSGFWIDDTSAEDCVINGLTVKSTLFTHNLVGTTGSVSPDDPGVGPLNIARAPTFVGDSQARPIPDAHLTPGTDGAGWASKSTGQPVYDGLGVAYATVSLTDLDGNLRDPANTGFGCYDEPVAPDRGPSRTGLYRWDGIEFWPHDLWRYEGPGTPWQPIELVDLP
jgi:hypothetical protein